jgi:hypothetical protein
MNLNNVKYINEFRRLPFPKNEMLIVGSGTLALLGIRKNNDMDIWVTKRVIKKVSEDKRFVRKKSEIDNSFIYESTDGIFEISSSLPPLKDTVEEQLKRAIVIYGIHFQAPKDVLEWKKLVDRPKDRSDIQKLEIFLKNNVVENYLRALQSLI